MWRLNNLYFIKDKQGKKVRFKPNWAQQELVEGLHTCNIILKARQLGITTFFCIYLLDQVLWNNGINAAICAHTIQDSQSIFIDKLKYTFDHLHPAIRQLFHAVGDSATELRFSHDSSIRVGTSMRSSTLQYLHLSEFGKVCCKFPEKAREVITGSLNTIAPGQFVVIESTAEGKNGYFYDMCQKAMEMKRNNVKLGPLDYKMFFFPWYKSPDYTL